MKVLDQLPLLILVALVSFVSVKLAIGPAGPPAGAAAAAAYDMPQPMPMQPQVVVVSGGDDRYTRAPRPQQSSGIGLSSIPTRGLPDDYQQMGLITGSDGKPLPLYGRRTDPRSSRFNYYTRTDTYNPVALPLTYKRKDCQDAVGCEELMSGDEIRITPSGDSAKVTLYGFDGPRYIPN